MNLLVVHYYNLVKTIYLEKTLFWCPNRQKMETNTVFIFAYLIISLFNK